MIFECREWEKSGGSQGKERSMWRKQQPEESSLGVPGKLRVTVTDGRGTGDQHSHGSEGKGLWVLS